MAARSFARTLMLSLVLAMAVEKCALQSSDACEGDFPGMEFMTVEEDAPIGTVLGQVYVKGTDVTLELKRELEEFVFDPISRNITLQKTLDSDISQEIKFFVICKRSQHDPSPMEITVVVTIKDVNEHPPTFALGKYYIPVREDMEVGSTIVTNVTATDLDPANVWQNSRIDYSILPELDYEYFNLPSSSNLALTLIRPLDYDEGRRTLNIRVMAENQYAYRNERLNSTAYLTIQVLDVDDQNPIFSNLTYIGTVNASSTVGTKVEVKPVIYAHDKDNSSPIEYYLIDPENRFRIDNTSGEVTVNGPLTSSFVTVVLRAVETDNACRSDIALLYIYVTGDNIYAPQFLRPRYEASVSEAEAIGSTLLTTVAVDRDIGATVRYAIIEQDAFSVDDIGNVMLERDLDFEEKSLYVFNMTATDGMHTSTATVTIHVTDINDNNPEIQQKDVTVDVQREEGALVTVVEAADADPGTILDFHLLTYINLFVVNSEGEVSVRVSSEELTADTYTLIVRVCDDGHPHRESYASVTVNFPPVTTVPPRVEEVSRASSDSDMLVIIFGALAGVLLLTIIFLLIYIMRRRQYVREQLDKAKIHRGIDPKGLAFKQSPRQDLNSNLHREEISDIDGATTIQENPLRKTGLNYGYLDNSDNSEMDREIGEIEIETAVIPYDEGYKYHTSDHGYSNGSLPTLQTFSRGEDCSSSESSHSDSTGCSSKDLMRPSAGSKKSLPSKKTSWDSVNKQSLNDSNRSLEPDQSVIPLREKPEITVYF